MNPSDPEVDSVLRDHFRRVHERASMDFVSRPVAPRRPVRAPWPIAPIVVALAVAALGLSLRVGSGPGATDSSAASAAATTSFDPTVAPSVPSSTAPNQAWPSSIAGQPVLSGIAIGEHVRAAVDGSPFLIAGYLEFAQADCAIDSMPSALPLVVPCDDGWTLSSTARPRLADASASADRITYRLVVESVGGDWPGSGEPTVVRVHAHDPRAARCPDEVRDRCEQALVAEAIVWP